MKLILASASPRRAEILHNAGFCFETRPADADETLLLNERAAEYVQRLAEAKARIIADAGPSVEQSVVIGADTVVLVQGQVLGKPSDGEEARNMLGRLSGTTHEVITGLALISLPNRRWSVQVESTRVTFLHLSDAEIAAYVATGEPFDKAGAYGIQGIGGRFVSKIEGCYFNVMGLPVSRLWQMLRKMEIK